MALTRREFQLLMERVAKLEAKVRVFEDQFKIVDQKMRPDILSRSLKNWEDTEKHKHDRPL